MKADYAHDKTCTLEEERHALQHNTIQISRQQAASGGP